MNFTFRYYILLFALIVTVLTSCSVGNKYIPDPGGGIGVDTTNTSLNSFKVYITGDTSFTMNITTADSLNTIIDDSLIVTGYEITGSSLTGLFGFKTFSSAEGSYLTEGSPPGITAAEIGIVKTLNGVRKIYTMNHGTITITLNDPSLKIIKGHFDVNNLYGIGADRYLRAVGYFFIKYQ